MSLNNSLTPVTVDMILTSIDTIAHRNDERLWLRELASSSQIFREFEVSKTPFPLGLTRAVYLDEEGKESSLYLLRDSNLFHLMRKTLFENLQRIEGDKPVRRYVFDGPLIMTNHYRSD